MAPRVEIDGVLMSSFHYIERYLFGYTYILLGLILISVIVRALSRALQRHDPREPPLVAPRIPVIGHNLAILRDGPGAWLKIQYVATDPLPFRRLITLVNNLQQLPLL